jgi:hypothetical protein
MGVSGQPHVPTDLPAANRRLGGPQSQSRGFGDGKSSPCPDRPAISQDPMLNTVSWLHSYITENW